jgi:hypothetical protein
MLIKDEDTLGTIEETHQPMVTTKIKNYKLTAILQWTDRAHVVSIEENSLKIVQVKDGDLSVEEPADMLEAGSTEHGNSTAVVDSANAGLMACAFTNEYKAITNAPDEEPKTWNRSVLLNNVWVENPSSKKVVMTEAVGTDLVLRVFDVNSDGTASFTIEFHIPYVSEASASLTGCSNNYFAVSYPNSVTEIYDYQLELIQTLDGKTSSHINKVSFLDNQNFLWIMRTRIGHNNVYHYPVPNSDQSSKLDLQIPATHTTDQTNSALIAKNPSNPSNLEISAFFYLSNYVNQFFLTFENLQSLIVDSVDDFHYGYSRGFFWTMSQSELKLRIPRALIFPGADEVRYETEWFDEYSLELNALPSGQKYFGILFDFELYGEKSNFFYLVSGFESEDGDMYLRRVATTSLSAECVITSTEQQAYTNEIPVFYGEYTFGRYGYKNSFSFLLKTESGDSFGEDIILIGQIVVTFFFVVTIIVGIVLMCKASNKITKVKPLKPI